MLSIKDLHASVEDKAILKGLNLEIKPGEVHAIMGPNGAGKSTMGYVMSGREGYIADKGSVSLAGVDLLELDAEERARAGLFLAFQYPVEIPGVSNLEFMKAAVDAHRQARGEEAISSKEFLKEAKEACKTVDLPLAFLKRGVNEGFSGGEKKRNEIMQMLLLKPKLCILDESDSGLDIDALQVVAAGVNSQRSPDRSFIVVTHYQRLLDYIKPDFVHVLSEGKIVRSGPASLALELEAQGYGWLTEQRAGDEGRCLMSDWLGGAVARAESVNDWLSPRRQASLALLRQQSWPNRKVEAWKYTPVFALERADLSAAKSVQLAAESIEARDNDDNLQQLDSIDLVYIDGRFQPGLSSTDLPVGLSILPLADGSMASDGWAAETFASVKPERHLFGLVNDVLATSGLIVDVAAGATIERPIRILNILQGGVEAHSRAIVRLGAAARASVIEQYVGTELSFNTGFAEYDLGEGAQLEHYRFALQTQQAMNVGGSHFKLAKKAELNSTLVGFGSKLSRVDVDIHHAGEFTQAKFNAIYLLQGEELFDLHATVEHAQPNGNTEENIRGIVADRSRAVFNGRIHIHRNAQKVLAELNNRNLLMSRDAQINTKPELEIYADDVRCAHGATVAELDDKALYYMQSRGLSRLQAQVMLNFGFINELVDQMPNQILAQWLRPQLRQRFEQMAASSGAGE